MNYIRIIFLLLAFHFASYGLSGCGKKKASQGPVCAPNDFQCLNGITQQFGFSDAFGNYVPFYENARVTDKKNFQKMMDSDFNGGPRNPYVGNWEWQNRLWDHMNRCFGGGCSSLQIRLIPLAGDSFSVILRGNAVGHGPRVVFDPFNSTYESTPATSFLAEAQLMENDTMIRFNQRKESIYNPYPHSQYEHNLNHLFLDAKGSLNSDTMDVTLYYAGRNGNPVIVATGKLRKGMDY